MGSTAPSSGGSFGTSQFQKHVTTACDSCRRKRCKCDGQTPCSTCHNVGIPCVYNSSDRRRQKRDHNTVHDLPYQPSGAQAYTPNVRDDSQPHTFDQSKDDALDGSISHMSEHNGDDDSTIRSQVASQSIRLANQDNEEHETVNSQSSSVRSQPREMALPEMEVPHNIAANQVHRHEMRPIAPCSKRRGGAGKSLEPKVSALTDLQGKFETRAHNTSDVGTTREHTHRQYTGVRSSAPQRLLPKDTPTFRAKQTRNLDHSRTIPDDQQQSRQFEWQLRRRPFAAPGYTRTFGNLPFSSSIVANGYPVEIQHRQTRNFSTPEHLLFPLLDKDDSPLGRAIVDFQRMGQRLIAEGVPPLQVADQGLIDVTLFFRDRVPQDPVNASTWTSEMLKTFRGILPDELLLACAFGVGSLLRWFLMPTPENYGKIPAMVRPTDMQRLKPHPAWVDLMVFPSFRNALINNVRDWVEPCLKARWEILWPNSLEEAVVHDHHSQRVFLTQEFADFAVNPENWLMQRVILEDFPEIEGSEINIARA